MTPSTIWAPGILSLLRIVLGLVLLEYGLAKLFGWPAVRIFQDLPWLSLYGVAGMFELVGGTLLDSRTLHAAGGFHPVRRNGGGLFHRTSSAQILSIKSDGDLAVSLCFAFL